MKTKVRIAIAVDETGGWSATGWNPSTESCDENMVFLCVDELMEDGATLIATHWIEAEVDIPAAEPEAVKGTLA